MDKAGYKVPFVFRFLLKIFQASARLIVAKVAIEIQRQKLTSKISCASHFSVHSDMVYSNIHIYFPILKSWIITKFK